MIIGIVGHEAAKFTRETQARARSEITCLLQADIMANNAPTVVVSGACHLGGIDIWAIEEAKVLGLQTIEYPPAVHRWEGGYRERNIQIAEAAELVVSVVVKTLPASYSGMRFSMCYHCGVTTHVKSGGCWTAKWARQHGKRTRIIEI
jgi:hypothetical protein